MNKQLEKTESVPNIDTARVGQNISPTEIALLNRHIKKWVEENRPDLLEGGGKVLISVGQRMLKEAKGLRRPRPKFDKNEFLIAVAAAVAAKLDQSNNESEEAEKILQSMGGGRKRTRADKGFKRGEYKGGKHGKHSVAS